MRSFSSSSSSSSSSSFFSFSFSFSFSFAVAIAFFASLLGSVRDATADRKILTGLAGCNQEFKGNKGAQKQCGVCVKSNGKYKKLLKNKGAWTCEGGSDGDGGGGGGGGPTEAEKMAHLKASKPLPTRVVVKPKKPAVNAFYAAYASVKPATFWMGSRETEADRESGTVEKRTKLTITRGFKMKTTEVTQNEWYNVTGDPHYSYDETCGWDCPVNEVNWHQTLEYLNALSKREKLEACYDFDAEMPAWPKALDCKGYRLPTEAEWELAARGGTTEARYGVLDEIAWTYENAEGAVHPVGGKQANAFGLYDMLGNVSEFTWDAYVGDLPKSGTSDPIRSGDEDVHTGSSRTVRGGSFDAGKATSRAAYRESMIPNAGSKRVGFRPVRTE